MKLISRHFAAKRLFQILCIAMLPLAVCVPARAEANFTMDVMTVAGAWAKATPPGSETTAVYMTILNNSDGLDNLIGATTPVAERVEIRDSAQKNALMRSVPLKHSDAVTFKPGGIHLVLIGLKHQLVAREKFPMTFVFENATKVTTEISVLAPDNKLPLGIDENGWQ